MGIQKISQSVSAALSQEGSPAITLGDTKPMTSGREVLIPGSEKFGTGIWECTPGSFRRHLTSAEVMHFIAGYCTFTPEGGETVEINAGDTVFFPEYTEGVWHVETTVRKIYVLLGEPAAPKPAA
jgi:uncharacterized cupin superfamily protein